MLTTRAKGKLKTPFRLDYNAVIFGTSTRSENMCARMPGGDFRLEPKVMDVLVYLARHDGEVLPKKRIIQAVWPDAFVTDDVLTHAVSNLRKAFGEDAQEGDFIETIPKRGYRLAAPAVFEDLPRAVDTDPGPSGSGDGRAAPAG